MFSLGNINSREIIGRGSNSVVYDLPLLEGGLGERCVAKCSLNPSNYISFNLQKHSYRLCHEIFGGSILVPKVYDYYFDCNIGDVLVLEKMNNLYDIDFIINNGFYYSELIISEIAKAIAALHDSGISGYDVEFYWNPQCNKLVMLDIGPPFTFGISTCVALRKHWELEEKNSMGLWNIISQIIDLTRAKEIFKSNSMFEIVVDELYESLDPASLFLHVENVAKVHALGIFGKLYRGNRDRYVNLFVKKYLGYSQKISMDHMRYISSFKEAVTQKITKAKAKLYYSLKDVLSEESCCVEIRGW